MTRARPAAMRRLASVLALVAFGLMLLSALRLFVSGPLMQRAVDILPFGSERDAAQAENRLEQPLGSGSGFGLTEQDDDLASDPVLSASGGAASGEVGASTVPGLALSKTRLGPSSVSVGDLVRFRIGLTNTGVVPLTDLDLRDDFDTAYMAYRSAEPPPSVVNEAAGELRWENLAEDSAGLAPGMGLFIELSFEAIAATPPEYRAFNTARAQAQEGRIVVGPETDDIAVSAPPSLCLGDLVFMELVDDGRYEPAVGDLGVQAVKLSLAADADLDGELSAEDPILKQVLTDADGRYRFCELEPGDYIVIVEASNFAENGPLAGLRSSTGGLSLDQPADPDDDVDDDDNGLMPGGDEARLPADISPALAVYSAAISLGAGQEPDVDVDGDDTNGNLTLDFGFAAQASVEVEPLPLPGPIVEEPADTEEEVAPEAPGGSGSAEVERRGPSESRPGYGKPTRRHPGHGKPVHPRRP